MSRPDDVHLDPDATPAVLAADLHGPLLHFHPRQLRQRQARASRRVHEQARERFDRASVFVREPDRHVRHAVLQVDLRHGLAAHRRLDQVEHVRRVHAVAGDPFAIHRDREVRLAGHLLLGEVLDASHLRQHARHLAGLLLQHAQVVAEQLDDHLRPRAGHQLVDPALDRLAEAGHHAGDVGDGVAHLVGQFLARRRAGPLATGFQRPDEPGLVHAPGFDGDAGLPGARHHGLEFGELHQALLDLERRLERLVQRHAGQQLDVHVERPLVHDRQELGAEARHERERTEHEHAAGHDNRRPGGRASTGATGRYTRRIACRTGLSCVSGFSTTRHSTGITKIDSSSDASSASATVNASGENIFPSRPCSVMIGTKVRAMISSPRMLGCRTSTAADSTVAIRPFGCRSRRSGRGGAGCSPPG